MRDLSWVLSLPNDPRFSCGRQAPGSEIYVPLIAIGEQPRAELGPGLPVSCKRWLGRNLRS